MIFASVLPVSDAHKDEDPSYERTPSHPPAFIRALNDWLRASAPSAATRTWITIRLWSTIQGSCKRISSDDGLHPNAKGYRVMAPLLTAAVNRATGSFRASALPPPASAPTPARNQKRQGRVKIEVMKRVRSALACCWRPGRVRSTVAQRQMTVPQLVSFIRSSIQLHQDDRQVADIVRRIKLSNRLDDEDRRRVGRDWARVPRTVAALKLLETASASLAAAAAARAQAAVVVLQAPDPLEQKRVLAEVTENALVLRAEPSEFHLHPGHAPAHRSHRHRNLEVGRSHSGAPELRGSPRGLQGGAW